MSRSTGGDENESDEPLVPEEVLERIQDLKDGETASKDDLESVLKF